MHLLPLISAACLLLRFSVAVFDDEAWNVDYHYALLGVPKQDTTFFHQPNPASRASLLYTLSELGVLGAVNPRDGAVVWRQVLADAVSSCNASFLRAGEGQDVVVSGLGSQVAAWSAADGRLVWSLDVGGRLEDVEIVELSDGKETAGAKDAIALSSGANAAAARIDGASGAVKWRFDIDSDIPYQLSASNTELFAILLHKTLLGYLKLRVLSLDPVTGYKKDEYMLSSESELATTNSVISVGANSASPIVAWTDASHTVLNVNVLGTKGISSFKVAKHGDEAVERIRLYAPYHTNSRSHFLAHFSTATSHWAEVFHVDIKTGKVEKAYSLPKVKGNGTFSTSSVNANVYFTRITHEELMTVSSASHGVLGRWPLQSFRSTHIKDELGEPAHAVSEISIKGDTVSAIRTAVLLSTGDWILLRDGNPVWNRPEVLASTVSATFAAPQEAEALVQDLKAESHSNPLAAYFHRVKRHLADLQQLPAILASLPQRVVKGFLGTSADAGDMTRDTFGFHQVIACATENGRLIALDAGNPDRILWNKQVVELPLGQSWQPSLSSQIGGVIEVSTKAGSRLQYNATDGEQLASILPIDSEEEAARQVMYKMTGDSLEASIDSNAVWHFRPMAEERILSLVPRPVNDPVASIGKVLGDRRVLYKYLDPNLALLVTARDSSNTATVYVLNTVSGAILYSNIHAGVDLSAPIPSIMSENWFAYSLTTEASVDGPKGHQLVVGELFESLVPNDRGPLAGRSNYSSTETNTEPFTLTHTYQIPESISKLAVTRTRQGITSRQLLAVLPDSSAIVAIPYPVLDPRRTVNRDLTKDEQAEGLTRYAPVIEFDPKWYLNHAREVIGVKNIVTNPALIESTSLVFAYGLDIFGTRLSPSFSFDILGKDFNKFQMLATVAALALATLVVAPLVTRKQVDGRWRFL